MRVTKIKKISVVVEEIRFSEPCSQEYALTSMANNLGDKVVRDTLTLIYGEGLCVVEDGSVACLMFAVKGEVKNER